MVLSAYRQHHIRRTKGSRENDSKEPTVQISSFLLRDEGGGRAKVAAGNGHMHRAEPDLAAAETEARSADEETITATGKLFSSAVHVQLFPADEPFGMNQNDGTDADAREAEFVLHENLARATTGTATVAHSELSRDDEDIAGLLLGKLAHHLRRSVMNLQVRGIDLAFTVVVERP